MFGIFSGLRNARVKPDPTVGCDQLSQVQTLFHSLFTVQLPDNSFFTQKTVSLPELNYMNLLHIISISPTQPSDGLFDL